MLLKEEFKRSGTWLFRWRSLLPLLVITLFLGAFTTFHYPSASHNLDQLWEIMCLALSFMGLGVRAFTLGSVPKGTSGRNTRRIKGDSLNTTGMYSVVRHPLYLGNFIIGLGISLFFRLWWFTLIYVLIFWLYYERIIFAEEEFLLKKFGQPYLKWAEKTPTFIPKSRNWKPSAFPFSFRTALKREYHTLMAITASFAFLEILGDFFVKGRIVFDPVWMIIFPLGALIWITLRLVHKKTKVLNVERR